jgi:cytoskeletal protein RodZ
MVENNDREAELPLEGVGAQLARAREAAGRTLTDLSARTRIAERQLVAIEAGRWSDLPSRIYAVGFTRTYAKELGLDGNAFAKKVREELNHQEPDNAPRPGPVFEPGDPARLPGRKVAWFAAAGLVAVLAAGLVFWPQLFSPAGTLPSLLKEPAPAPVAVATPAPSPSDGPVVFTATRDRVWVRFADGAGQQLLQKELALGESWTVPAGVTGVTLTTARPDGLAITVSGRTVPPLATTEQTMRDIPVTATALLARGTTEAATAAGTTAATATTTATPARQQRPPVRPAQTPAEAVSVPPTRAPATTSPASSPTVSPAPAAAAGDAATADS